MGPKKRHKKGDLWEYRKGPNYSTRIKQCATLQNSKDAKASWTKGVQSESSIYYKCDSIYVRACSAKKGPTMAAIPIKTAVLSSAGLSFPAPVISCTPWRNLHCVSGFGHGELSWILLIQQILLIQPAGSKPPQEFSPEPWLSSADLWLSQPAAWSYIPFNLYESTSLLAPPWERQSWNQEGPESALGYSPYHRNLCRISSING